VLGVVPRLVGFDCAHCLPDRRHAQLQCASSMDDSFVPHHIYVCAGARANPIRAWREMSDLSFSIVLALLMFLCYFGADIALNWREITTKRAAFEPLTQADQRLIRDGVMSRSM
jgi:hypothetical protein